MWFGQSGKLTLRYISLYTIKVRIGEVAYSLQLPDELFRVRNAFHVSQLRKCIPDSIYMIKPQPL